MGIRYGIAKIPSSFCHARTPCASPLRALAHIRVSAAQQIISSYHISMSLPLHAESQGLLYFDDQNSIFFKLHQKCEELCGLKALRSYWGSAAIIPRYNYNNII